MNLEGKVALVTGGAKGLGLAIATHLADVGAVVIVVDRDADAFRELDPRFECRELDVTQPEQAKAISRSVAEDHGRIDILVNNAGVIYSEPLVNIMNPASMMHDYGRFRDSLTVNLDSVFIMTSSVVEQMVLRRTRGVIVNISSISACGNEGQTAYSAAKGAVNAMTVTWSKELARLGIRCNAVAPGFIDTESTRAALHESAIKYVKSNTPLRRLGQADEIAQAVALVIGNDFINGVILPVNGGLSL